MSYSKNYICKFESRKSGKDGKKLQKFEYLENEKSLLDKIRKVFMVFEGLSSDEKMKIWSKIADTSFKNALSIARIFWFIIISI